MSSTNKTSKGLSQYIETDMPDMSDVNNDNQIIDKSLQILVTNGDGTKYLSDNGKYNTVVGGGGNTPPYIGDNGNWYEYNVITKKWFDSGVRAQGDKGETGEQGIQGIQGETGLQGIQGIQGIQGDKGEQGLKGDTGLQGIQGERGLQGEQGLRGNDGTNGINGLKGDKGDIGLTGERGEQGVQGLQGIQGERGLQGIQGEKGDKGDKGDDNFTLEEKEKLANIIASTKATATITTGWIGSTAPYRQTIPVAGVTSTNVIEISLPSTVTTTEVEQYQALNLQDGGQSAGNITLLAFGEKNTEDIPVNVVIRGDL